MLEVAGSHIGKKACSLPPAAAGTLTALTSLKLDSNALSGSIPASFSALVNLLTLDIHGNSLSGTLEVVGTFAAAGQVLTSLAVDHNSFTGEPTLRVVITPSRCSPLPPCRWRRTTLRI